MTQIDVGLYALPDGTIVDEAGTHYDPDNYDWANDAQMNAWHTAVNAMQKEAY